MIDVEVLNNKEFKIAESVKFKTIKEQVATMVVNGLTQQTQEVESVAIVCPNCETILAKLDSNTPITEVYRAFGEMPKVKNMVDYCPNCGTKLTFDKRIVSEQ